MSQATHDIFRVPVLESHQNLVNANCILLHSESGSLKHCMVWLGIEERTLFSMVILPAVERCLVLHPLALCLILSTVNRSRFLCPKCSGTPKYFPSPPSTCIPSSAFIFSLSSVGVLLEKVMPDF